MNRRGGRWLESLGNFSISHFSLKSSNIDILKDAFSRAPHIAEKEKKSPFNFSTLDVLKITFNGILSMYQDSQFFEPIFNEINGKVPSDLNKEEFLIIP